MYVLGCSLVLTNPLLYKRCSSPRRRRSPQFSFYYSTKMRFFARFRRVYQRHEDREAEGLWTKVQVWQSNPGAPYTCAMNAPMQQWLLGQPHGNHRLFSDHYLDVTLPGRKQRKDLVEQTRPVVEEIASDFALCAPSERTRHTPSAT